MFLIKGEKGRKFSLKNHIIIDNIPQRNDNHSWRIVNSYYHSQLILYHQLIDNYSQFR